MLNLEVIQHPVVNLVIHDSINDAFMGSEWCHKDRLWLHIHSALVKLDTLCLMHGFYDYMCPSVEDLNSVAETCEILGYIEAERGTFRYRNPAYRPMVQPQSNSPEDVHSMEYKDYLASATWKSIRDHCLWSDGHKCTQCGSTKSLNVHHINYPQRGTESRDDLTTLCRKCHAAIHGKETADATNTNDQA